MQFMPTMMININASDSEETNASVFFFPQKSLRINSLFHPHLVEVCRVVHLHFAFVLFGNVPCCKVRAENSLCQIALSKPLEGVKRRRKKNIWPIRRTPPLVFLPSKTFRRLTLYKQQTGKKTSIVHLENDILCCVPVIFHLAEWTAELLA